MSCQYHPGVEMEWSEKVNGRSVFGCPECRKRDAEEERKRRVIPRVRFSQQWHRDRPLMDKEKGSLRPPKPT